MLKIIAMSIVLSTFACSSGQPQPQQARPTPQTHEKCVQNELCIRGFHWAGNPTCACVPD